MSTRTSVFADQHELAETLGDLRHSFGDKAILEELESMGVVGRKSTAPAALEAIRRLVGLFLDTPPAHRAIAVDALAIACGVSSQTQTEAAVQHGITRQAMSRRVLQFSDSLGLPPTGEMKSQEDRINFRQTNGRGDRATRRGAYEVQSRARKDRKLLFSSAVRAPRFTNCPVCQLPLPLVIADMGRLSDWRAN